MYETLDLIALLSPSRLAENSSLCLQVGERKIEKERYHEVMKRRRKGKEGGYGSDNDVRSRCPCLWATRVTVTFKKRGPVSRVSSTVDQPATKAFDQGTEKQLFAACAVWV